MTGQTFKAALEPTFPPFDTTDSSGKLTGLDVDLINAIAEDQGFTVKWENLQFDGLIPALQAGNIDIIASGMSITPEREKQVDFSDPYYDSGLVVAVASDNNTIKGEDDLTPDMKVAVQIGTTGAAEAQDLKDGGKIAEVVVLPQLDTAMMQLINGTYSNGDFEMFREIYDSLLTNKYGRPDQYFSLADFKSYAEAQRRVEEAYRDQTRWAKMAITNVACSGKFTSDRTIQEYVDEIWHLDHVKIDVTPEKD